MPLTVHTDVAWLANVTAKPEVAVAVNDNGDPITTEPGALKVIVCGNGVTEKLLVTVVAASQ